MKKSKKAKKVVTSFKPILPYTHTVLGLRLLPREPMIDAKTQKVLDDGTNHVIVLGGSETLTVAEFFLQNVKRNTTDKIWRIWLESKV